MHPDAQVVMQGFAAFGAGDMAGLKEMFADDATWTSPGNNKFSGTYSGPDAIIRLMEDVQADATVVNQPHDILASDDHVVVLVNATMTKGDESLDVRNVFVFHVDGGKVQSAWLNSSNEAAVDAFFGS